MELVSFFLLFLFEDSYHSASSVSVLVNAKIKLTEEPSCICNASIYFLHDDYFNVFDSINFLNSECSDSHTA